MRFVLLNLRRLCRSPHARRLCGILLVLTGLSGCAGVVGSTGGGGNAGTTTVTILTTSTANDQLYYFGMVLNSITLTSRSGGTASLITTPIVAEFMHLNGATEPLLTVTLPQGVYTAATASVGSAGFRCVSFDSSNGDIDDAGYGYGYTPASHVTMSLPSPITIAGDHAVVLLNLQVSQSASWGAGNCAPISSNNWSITPTFTIALAGDANPMQFGLNGMVKTVTQSSGSFTVTAADAPNCIVTIGSSCNPPAVGPYAPAWQVATDNNTVFEGVAGISQLVAGLAIDMDAALRPDGSLLAKRIAVYDADPSNLTVVSGPVERVYNTMPVIYSAPTESLGPQNDSSGYSFNFSNAIFQTSSQFNNLQDLPFPASFNATNMVSGQNIYASMHALVLEPSPTDFPATTITLIPQTINGTVSAMGSEGGFTTYTVTLAPYDLFPQLAVQTGQTTLLTNPNTVIVYADSNTQMLNTSPVAVGNVVRFYGLVFNDNGTLRMDCAQVMDGVAE